MIFNFSRIDSLVRRLYSGMPCTACGLRFLAKTQTSRYADHLDWHFRQNRKERKGDLQTHRQWYYTAWVSSYFRLNIIIKSQNNWITVCVYKKNVFDFKDHKFVLNIAYII
jgi:hypothetical protein